MKSTLKKIAPFISLIFFGLAIWFLNQELGQYSLDNIGDYISHLSAIHIVGSLILSGLSYLLLTGYDALGVEYVGEDLSYDKIGKAGFIGYAFSHNIGMALLTGGSIRYRLYSAWGLTGVQVTKIVGFSALTLWIGFCSMGGLSLLLYSPTLPADVLPNIPLGLLGIILLAMVFLYLIGSAVITKTLSLWKWSITFPDLNMAVKQVAIASLDWLLASSVLYVLMPGAGIPFFGFVGVFLLAQIAGLFSQVPGGLGVFESIMVLYLSHFLVSSNVVGILIVYRLIYYLIPLALAMMLLSYQEYQANREVVKEFGSRTANWVPRVVPSVFSVTIFIGGAVLLFSGAMPSDVPRMEWLQPLIPLPVIEMSHFFASIVGAALLVLAHGLQRRIDAAYHATIGVLVFGIIFSLLKGVSYVEAAILAVMLLALIPSRKQFHRKAALFSESFSSTWITLILLVIISSILLGLFSYSNVKYQDDLWWQFTLLGDAPRYLRASVAVLGVSILFGLYKLLRPGRSTSGEADYRQFQAAAEIMHQSETKQSNLLLLGDKKIMLNNERTACIMYGVQDRSWVAMGDPVGPASEVKDLAWDFKELGEENESWPVFYQVTDKYVDLYEDLGLTMLKLGEEANIKLNDFEWSAESFPDLFANYKKWKSNNYHFDVIPPEHLARHMDEMRSVSDAWLKVPGHQEKRFSMGYFKPDYLRHFPVATVRENGQIMAFSNLCASDGNHEIGYDLMRYKPGADEGVADYLLTEIIRWAKQKDYESFNLGLAPLAEMGQKEHQLKWAKFADQLYNYGPHLYNFEDLRHHMDKYNPHWKPIYLAAPAGLAMPTVLSNLAELISRSGD